VAVLSQVHKRGGAAVSRAIADNKTTRRNMLKLAGAAALGAAGVAALRTTKVHAAGSGNTLGSWFSPYRVLSATLAGGADLVAGPFPTPGQPFLSDSYYGLAGNLTASRWGAHGGWLSVRPHGADFVAPAVPLLYYGGHAVDHWSNFFIERFGSPLEVPPPDTIVSDGQLVIHNGAPSAVHVTLDVYFYLGPDQGA
jgi:hypothetical protein